MREEKQLVIRRVSKSFQKNGQELHVLDEINLEVGQGEFICIIGKSGCGKSTLLRIIAGLERQYKGGITLDDVDISGPSLERGIVFQDHRLLPWLTLEENVGLGIPDRDPSKQERVDEYIRLVGLEQFKRSYPKELSGGMSQRAAIARALVNNPKILLMDEPLGALDAMTRISLQEEILKIWKKKNITVILVTHDMEEALFLGTKVVVFGANPGHIKHIYEVPLGRPRDRNSIEFTKAKKLLFEEFFEGEEVPFSYVI